MARILSSRAVLAVALVGLFGFVPEISVGQDNKPPEEPPSPLGGEHNSRDPRKCKKCSPALSKALSFLSSKGSSAGFAQGYMLGWLGLVDPSSGQYATKCLSQAGSARAVGFNGNWFTSIPGIFLAGAYYRYGDGRAASGMQAIATDAQKNQHHTGGWHHNKNFKMQGYSEDLGIVTAMLFGMFMTLKGAGSGLPKDMIDRCEKNIESIMGSTGIGYGTGKGDYDTAGSRGAYAFMGLHFGGQTDHPFYEKLKSAIARQIKTMDKGHAVGCLHFLSMSIANYLAGNYDALATEWIDKLIAKQGADGSILLGDDGVGGGEEKNIGGKVGSTAVFAIMLLLQKPGAFDPPKKKEPAAKGKPAGGSPFGKPKEKDDSKVETPGTKK
ncbi:MAG TPA: DUF6288 domain-containing protein [Planctomycetota bacterium]|nr:DUF6288 domain-containing protein [Planctomycetota bacterium]